MRLKHIMLCLVATAIGTGCTYSIHQVHVSDFDGIPKGKGRVVSAESEQQTILGMVGDTDYVEDAYVALQAKCKGGRLQGITTQYSTAHGFFSWTNKILMQGLCIK